MLRASSDHVEAEFRWLVGVASTCYGVGDRFIFECRGGGPRRCASYPVGPSMGSVMEMKASPLGRAGDKESSGGGITCRVILIKVY